MCIVIVHCYIVCSSCSCNSRANGSGGSPTHPRVGNFASQDLYGYTMIYYGYSWLYDLYGIHSILYYDIVYDVFLRGFYADPSSPRLSAIHNLVLLHWKMTVPTNLRNSPLNFCKNNAEQIQNPGSHNSLFPRPGSCSLSLSLSIYIYIYMYISIYIYIYIYYDYYY